MSKPDNKQLAAGLRTAMQAAEAGELAAAKQILAPLFQSFPGHPHILQLMGQIAHLEGRTELALNLIGQAISNDPKVASYHYSLGMVLIESEQFDAAESAMRRAIELQPNMPRAQIKLCKILRVKRQWQETRNGLQDLLRTDPDNNDIQYELACVENDAGEFNTALALLEPLTEADGYQFSARDHMARVHLSLGHIDQAEQCWRQALKIQPENGDVYRMIAMTRHYESPDDPDISAVSTLLEDPACPPENQMHLHLTLAKMRDDLGQWDAAFSSASKGKALHHEVKPFDRAAHRHRIEGILQRYDQAWFADLDSTVSESRPVFIIGMPRSGTTLLERMLIAHPEVASAGELDWFNKLATQPPVFKLDLLTQLRTQYLHELTKKAGNASHIIDKMPNNFLHVGQILSLFPQAKLIHLRRDPLDVCRSIYFQHLPIGQLYANDLNDLGDYYHDYRRLMAHWRKVAPGALIELEYEQLVKKPEEILKALLGWLDLDWDENCLSPHKSPGAVMTSSAAQIREPINTRGIGRAAAYADHFRPIADRLGLESTH